MGSPETGTFQLSLQYTGEMAAAVMSGSCHQNTPAEEGEECMENT